LESKREILGLKAYQLEGAVRAYESKAEMLEKTNSRQEETKRSTPRETK
jgi:hypothetical protein